MKKLRILLLALILPCALLFSACGNPGVLKSQAKANIGNKNAYAEQGADEELEEIFADEDNFENIESWRITASMEMGSDGSMKFNAIFKDNGDQTMDCIARVYMKMHFDFSAMLPDNATAEERAEAVMNIEMDYEMYMTDGYLYLNIIKLSKDVKKNMPEEMGTKLRINLVEAGYFMEGFGGDYLEEYMTARPENILGSLQYYLGGEVVVKMNQ